MNKLLVSALGITLALHLSACASALSVREPIAMRNYSPDSYAASNLLITNQVRMALPEGWRFKRREKDDAKNVRFYIKDTGSNTVTGVYRYDSVDFPIAVSKVAHGFADKGMDEFSDKTIAKTEIDGREAYVVHGTWKDDKQRASVLIQQGTQGVSEITLLADPGYFTRDPSTAYTIFNSYQFMPPALSERRIKGMYSFKCDDGSMSWFDDTDHPWESSGFVVSGTFNDEFVVLGITEVKTSRLSDFFKVDQMSVKEFETEVHIAGKSFPARAVGNHSEEKKTVSMHYIFNRDGKDYRMHVYRTTEQSKVADARSLHEEPMIRRALDTYFYFDS
jgi:hypothetical protein